VIRPRRLPDKPKDFSLYQAFIGPAKAKIILFILLILSEHLLPSRNDRVPGDFLRRRIRVFPGLLSLRDVDLRPLRLMNPRSSVFIRG